MHVVDAIHVLVLVIRDWCAGAVHSVSLVVECSGAFPAIRIQRPIPQLAKPNRFVKAARPCLHLPIVIDALATSDVVMDRDEDVIDHAPVGETGEPSDERPVRLIERPVTQLALDEEHPL